MSRRWLLLTRGERMHDDGARRKQIVTISDTVCCGALNDVWRFPAPSAFG